jgi:uncharacterized membrane protein YraQ (UPF0718 family)
MLALIIYFMGLLRFHISPEKVRDYLQGKSKFFAQLMAIALGGVTPFCSCSSIPLFLGFLRAGIPLSVVFTFLIASPMINEIAVIILIGVVGWKATLMFVAAGAIIAFFGGILMEKMGVEKYILNYEITAISLIIGLAIKKVKTTLSGIPARKNPKNNGMEEQEQNGVTPPEKYILNYEAIKNAKTMSMENLPIDKA